MHTRDRFLEAARRLFADKGFYGASMDQIARELGLTKQALIHHFGTKEKLYGAVLSKISTRLLDALESGGDDFPRAIEQIYRHTLDCPDEAQLLMRELLDNRRRAEQAGTWYLKPFLDKLHDALRRMPNWRDAPDVQVATHVCQVLGAINYFAISQPTLSQMYSAEAVAAMRDASVERLRRLATLPP
ncbi:MAG: hypothetical protein CMH65_04380 [Nevskiales bacterium]|nr:hypothetical protein [Nevskiales bacterium]